MPLEPLQAQRHPYLSQFATADWVQKLPFKNIAAGEQGGEERRAVGLVVAAASAICGR